MSSLDRSPLDWGILGLLASLVVANMTFLILQGTGGPLLGLVFYLVLFALAWRGRQRAHRSVVVGGFVGLVVHAVEVAAMGWSDYPVLVALNLVLPAMLALLAWSADRGPRRVVGDR